MENHIIKPFYDIKDKGVGNTGYFFLHNILKARADLHFESGRNEHDQEVNVYISGLLSSLIASDDFLKQKEYISAFDTDVRHYLEIHPGVRNQYVVYRDNADFGLVLQGIFLGYSHEGSYQHLVMPDADPQGRIALYYELAASALGHLQGTRLSLVEVFTAIAGHIEEILLILRRAAGYYFELLEKLSDGSLYHLERELDGLSVKTAYTAKLDEFLKAYSAYKAAPTEEGKQALMKLAGELGALNEKFTFEGI